MKYMQNYSTLKLGIIIVITLVSCLYFTKTVKGQEMSLYYNLQHDSDRTALDQVFQQVDYDAVTCEDYPSWLVGSVEMRVKNNLFTPSVIAYIGIGENITATTSESYVTTGSYANVELTFDDSISIRSICEDIGVGDGIIRFGFLRVGASGAFDARYMGSDVIEGYSGTGSGSQPTHDNYIIVRGYGDQSLDSRIVALNSPQAGTTSTSTSVVFDFDYFNNPADGLDKVGIELVNAISQFQYNTTAIEENINVSGNGNYISHRDNLTSGELHRWRAYMRDSSSSTTTVYSVWYSFDVVNRSGYQTQFTASSTSTGISGGDEFCDARFPFDNSDIISATKTFITNGGCKVVAFLFIPSDSSMIAFTEIRNDFENKFPFSYFYDAKDVFDTLEEDTEGQMQSLDITYSVVGAPQTVTLLSTSTIMMFMGESNYDIFYGIATASIWFMFLWYVYSKARGLLR